MAVSVARPDDPISAAFINTAGTIAAPGCPAAPRCPSSMSKALAAAQFASSAPKGCSPSLRANQGRNCPGPKDSRAASRMDRAFSVGTPPRQAAIVSSTLRRPASKTGSGKSSSFVETTKTANLSSEYLIVPIRLDLHRASDRTSNPHAAQAWETVDRQSSRIVGQVHAAALRPDARRNANNQ